MEASELVIVIPAYEPDHLLAELVDKLNSYYTGHSIIIVDDGSKNKEIFPLVEKKANVTVLAHECNMGKGAALKTAFTYISSLEGSHVIVTADSDGQHKPEDIFRVYNFYKKYNEGLILGSRKFEGDIPARSAFGNNCARFLLQSTNGIRLNDCQTGLRAFGNDLLPFLISISGNRYEYEMSMLSLAKQRNIPIHEIAIETVYINNNSGSHFRPVQDFTRICSVILKYTLPLFISMLFYIAGFIFLNYELSTVKKLEEYSFILASTSSAAFAFLVNFLLHGCGQCNGNPYLLRVPKKIIYYLSGCLVVMGVLVGSCYGLYSWWHNAGLSIFAGIVVTLFILWFQIYFFAEKSKMSEE